MADTFSSNGHTPLLFKRCLRKVNLCIPNSHLEGLSKIPYSVKVGKSVSSVACVPLHLYLRSKHR